MRYFYILLVIYLASCHRYPQGVRDALKLAGENRAELEAVLDHYSNNKADSLKYKAACFLIENMPEHYSFAGNDLDTFRQTVKEFGLRHMYQVADSNVRIVPAYYFDDKYPAPSFPLTKKVYDIRVITSEYLIENIELAFEAWEHAPQGKSITFDEFCEYILPYRTGNEPLENWRRKYNEMFRPVLDSLFKKDDIAEAGKILYDTISNLHWIFDNQVTAKHMGALSLLECRVGDCRLLADYATYVFRSVGIPSGIDCILQNPNKLSKFHYWNFIKLPSGRSIPFELYLTAPVPETGKINRKKGKVYRIHYNKQASSIALRFKKEKLPDLLNDDRLTDASNEYYKGATVEFSISENRKSGNLLYLGVFNNKTWIPITCSQIRQSKAVFRNIEPGIAYQALIYQNGQLISFSVPFIALENGQVYFLNPDVKHLQSMKLDRKYPLPDWSEKFKRRSIGGLFQGANKSDFSDTITLFTTKEKMNMYYHSIKINNPQKFKYLRYFSAPDGYCNMAEIQFISNGKELAGKVIGTDGVFNHSIEKSKYAVFDKDPVTYFDSSSPDGAWAGLELDVPSRVTEIEYLYRNDDNGIREGDVYELFYFSDIGLISLGKRTGVKNGTLFYDNVPSNALYLLHNQTRGREERIFTYENGKQVWW